MDIDNIDSTLATLQAKVNSFSFGGTNNAVATTLTKHLDSKKFYLACVALPVIIVLALIFIRPSFVTVEDDVDDHGEALRKLSMKKVLIVALLGSAFILGGAYYLFIRSSS